MNSLLKLRKKTRLSQQALADYIGVSRSLVKFAEQGLRELPKDAANRLETIENVVASEHFYNKTAAATLDTTTIQKLKEYHKRKIGDYMYKAEGLRLKLSALLKITQQSDAKVRLVNGLLKDSSKTLQTKRDSEWIKYHGTANNKKRSKQTDTITMLQYDIDVLTGYAAVHEKVLKKIG